MEGFLQGLALFIAGALLTRVAQIWRRLEEADREIGRAKRDHEYWVRRREREMAGEIAAADEGLNERGMLHSGLRGKSHRDIQERYVEDLKQQQDFTLRRVQDAFASFGLPERLYFKFIRRGKPPKRAGAVEAILNGRDDLLEGL